MRKGKSIQPKFAVVLALAIVLVLVWYGYKADWFKDIGVENTGAVAAAVSSTSGSKLVSGAKAVSGSTSSPQPVIAVTSWPTFELKYDSVGNENNLVVKAEYSVTAQGGKIYIPFNWEMMDVRNTLDQRPWGGKIETKILDTVTTANCMSLGPCYVIPEGKTVRFVLRQVYNPKTMFGGIYTARLNWFYFSTSLTDGTSFYYKLFPAQTSKLASVTVVGEKSPYLYTTVLTITQGQDIALKGIRLAASKPVVEGAEVGVVSHQDDGYIVFTSKLTPGNYRVYMSHPVYGNSNIAWLTVKKTGYPEVTLVSSDASVNTEDGNDDDAGIFTIKYRVEAVGGPIFISDRPRAIATTTAPYNVSDGMGVLYMVDEAGTPTTADLSSIVTFTTSDGATDSGVTNGVRLDDGESTEMTLTVARVNSGDSTDDGIYQVLLKGIGWATTDTPIFNIYQPKGIENYKTPPVSLN